MITCCISSSFTVGQFLMSIKRRLSGEHLTSPSHGFCCPAFSPPSLQLQLLFNNKGGKDVLISFDESLFLLFPTQEDAARATESSDREGTGSNKIRFLRPLTYTSFYEELRMYPKRKTWLLLRNASILEQSILKKQISIKNENKYLQRKNGYMLLTWYTVDNTPLSTYMIPNSITSTYSSEESTGMYTKSCEKMSSIIICMCEIPILETLLLYCVRNRYN